MTLEDIYNQLATGELRELFLGGGDIDDDEADGIPPASYPRLLPSVVLGLTELHKRFFLREGTLTVELQTGQSKYVVDTKYAVSNTRSTEPVKYIKDSLDPYQSNLFKLERFYGIYREEEYEIPLNERDNPASIMTSSYNTFIIPTDEELAPWLKETTNLDIRYRADHPVIDKYLANASPISTEIALPITHLEPLLFYIASRLHNPLGMTPGAMHEGNNYFQRFLASVEELKMQNYEIDDEAANTKLLERGFC